jgi:hypothetical protein
MVNLSEKKAVEWKPLYKVEEDILTRTGTSSEDAGLTNLTDVKTIQVGGQTIGLVTYVFYNHSVSAGTSQGIPATIVVDRDCSVFEVYLKVETAPGSGKTLTADVNRNGTSIFVDPTKQPSITGTNTTGMSGTPELSTLAKGDELTMDVDLNDGSPAKLSVYVRCLK